MASLCGGGYLSVAAGVDASPSVWPAGRSPGRHNTLGGIWTRSRRTDRMDAVVEPLRRHPSVRRPHARITTQSRGALGCSTPLHGEVVGAFESPPPVASRQSDDKVPKTGRKL